MLFSLCVFCQTYKGYVLNESEQPLESVSVSILASDSTALEFTISNEKGYFSVFCKSNQIKFIHFTCLGFSPKLINISEYKNESTIILTESDIVLREIEIKNERLRQNGDTLNFDVYGFRLAQDRNIKDVLKRLPGIEVDKDGKILYEGTAINKFYVENMDISDGKYNVITNNLSAKSVKSVQILENHQPITALRGSEFSDKAAINLVLEDESKNVFIGGLDVGLGVEENPNKLIWDNRILSLLFKEKMQNISVYKNNNTGIDLKEEIKNLLITNSISRSIIPDEQDIYSALSGKQSLIADQKRYFFNDTHLLTTNHLTKIDKLKTIRIQGNYLHEEEKQNRESSTTYFLPDADVHIIEKLHINDKKDLLEGSLSFNSNSQNNYINNNFKISSLFNTNSGYINANDEITTQKTKLDRLKLSNELEYIKNKGDRTYRFSTINVYNILPQNIEITPSLFDNSTDNNPDYLFQTARIKSFTSHSFTSFAHKLLGFNMQYYAGLKLKTQSLLSSTDPDNKVSEPTLRDSLYNNFRFTEMDIYLNPTLSYKTEHVLLRIYLSSALKNIYTKDILSQKQGLSDYRFAFEPQISFEYNYNAYWKSTARSGINKSYSDIYSLYSGYIVNSYRSASRNNGVLTIGTNYNNSIGLYYKNPVNGFFANASGIYSIRKQNNIEKVQFNGILQQIQKEKLNISNTNFNLFSNVSKSLPFWKSLLNFKYIYSDIGRAQFISEILTKYRNQSHDIEIGFYIQPIKMLNFEGEVNYLISRMKIVYPEYSKYDPVKNMSYKLTINVIPSKRIQVRWSNILYSNHNRQEKNRNMFFSDLSFSVINKKSEIQLLANNLFDTKSYKAQYINSLSESSNPTILHRRQLLVKYMFNF